MHSGAVSSDREGWRECRKLSGTIPAAPAALLVGRIQHSILPPRALLARRSSTLVVAYFILTRALSDWPTAENFP